MTGQAKGRDIQVNKPTVTAMPVSEAVQSREAEEIEQAVNYEERRIGFVGLLGERS
jgi:hypothetical protein